MQTDMVAQMKNSNDVQTIDVFEAPRRGRPVTGKALTSAQRKADQRQRDAEIIFGDVVTGPERLESVTLTGLLDGFAYYIKEGMPASAAEISQELIKRAQAKQAVSNIAPY